MAGEYRSVTEGAILVGTIIAWNWLIDWLNFRVPALQGWLEPPPLLLAYMEPDGTVSVIKRQHA